MPNDLQLKVLNAAHRTALKLSGGRVGWVGMGMPVVELTTVGRKSGLPRTVMLTSPLQEGSTIILVASRGGTDTNPAWLHNIRDNPTVEVAMKGQPKRKMHAREADAEERARLWPRVIADHKNYAAYQRKTERKIPLVLL